MSDYRRAITRLVFRVNTCRATSTRVGGRDNFHHPPTQCPPLQHRTGRWSAIRMNVNNVKINTALRRCGKAVVEKGVTAMMKGAGIVYYDSRD